MNNVFMLLAVAVVSSLLTLGLLVLGVRYWWQHTGREEVERRVDEMGDELQEKIRHGVKQGIADGIDDLPKDVVRSTTRSMTQTGMDIVEEGISTLLGSPPRRK